MKQVLFIMLALIPWILGAQQNSGEITYQETLKIQIEISEGDEAMKNMIPPTQRFSKKLLFTESASLYTDAGPAGEGDVDISNEEDGNQMRFVMKRPENILYSDLDASTTINKRDFFDRDFLISGKARECRWKLTGEQKKIGDYVCQKALLQDTTEQTVAWFTPQIQAQTGPGGYGMLPGLILELDIDGGRRTIMVTQVDIKPLGKDAVQPPKEGKKVTEEEFKKIEAEKMKEMGVEMGGNGKGARIMIIRTEDRN